MFPLATEVQVALIGAVVSVIGILVEVIRRKVNEAASHASEAKEQVKNSHTTNLRDDLDKMHEDIKNVLELSRANADAVRDLGKDMRVEREERMALSHRLDAALVVRAAQPADPPVIVPVVPPTDTA